MATTSAATVAALSSVTLVKNACQRKRNVVSVGLNSFGGLKAYNKVAALGLPVCTQQSFANVVKAIVSQSKGRGGGGGALSSTCNAAAEIFQIATTINGLVLIGVAVGFVLLRIEAAVEESE